MGNNGPHPGPPRRERESWRRVLLMHGNPPFGRQKLSLREQTIMIDEGWAWRGHDRMRDSDDKRKKLEADF